MNNFCMEVEAIFDIKDLGIVIGGTWNGEGTIIPGEYLIHEGKRYRVKRITNFPKTGSFKIGLILDCNLEEAKSLEGMVLEK